MCPLAHANLLHHGAGLTCLQTLNKRLIVDLLFTAPLTQWLGQQIHLLDVVLVPSDTLVIDCSEFMSDEVEQTLAAAHVSTSLSPALQQADQP